MSLYDKLGFFGAASVAIQTTPFYALLALPITFRRFARTLRCSETLEEFEAEHLEQKYISGFYAVFRPRGREVIPLLREHYGFD